MSRRRHFSNMYVITTISLSLVLFLIGIETVLLLSAHQLSTQIKEQVALDVVLKQDVDSNEVKRISRLMDNAPFAREYRYISAEQALQEYIEALGEDPTLYIDNPLHASFNVLLTADYAQADSLKQVVSTLEVFPSVERVIYPHEVVEAIDDNVNKYSLIIIGMAVLLLFIAVSLIVNTIRLQVYSRRFIINTMKLVGARGWAIKGPIVGKNMLLGIIASIIAIGLLVALLYYSARSMNIVLLQLTPANILLISAIVLLSSLLITIVSSLIAANSYIRMTTNDLYLV